MTLNDFALKAMITTGASPPEKPAIIIGPPFHRPTESGYGSKAVCFISQKGKQKVCLNPSAAAGKV